MPRNSVGAKQLRAGAVTTKTVKDRSLLGRDFKAGLPSGPPGPPGSVGAQGPRGSQGPPGSSLGYALVNGYESDPTVDPKFSKNVTSANVVRPADTTVAYCFKGLPFQPRVSVVTTNAVNDVLQSATIAGMNGHGRPDCQVQVQSFKSGSGTVYPDVTFMITFN